MKDSIKPATVLTLKDEVNYADDAVVSKTLTKNKNGNTTLFAFDKGQGLSEHAAPFDALAYIVDGKCRITIGGEEYELREGQMILMPATIPHAVEAIKPFKMMLIMIKDPK
ncbi:cupin domain-containing protein [Ekhidna sp.]|jgi:quercetin dioxygenase-like cupin family protein|uniref:cupin domain-containing protein n=1 Tax=Ekhidna sp. TaxID=2608089 RepID=UPI0032ED0F3C